jgi:hypothetical protein
MQLSGVKAMIVGLSMTMLVASVPTTAQAEPKPADDAALKRARWETEMLDNLYKNAIVLITTHYVTEETDLPAGSAFKALFATMKEKGYHEIRLLDGLGEPINDDNLPQDDFEKAGIEAMLAGKPIYEKVETRDGQRVLRTVTPLPMVMAKCVLCHDNYEGKKIVGGLGYAVPIDLK